MAYRLGARDVLQRDDRKDKGDAAQNERKLLDLVSRGDAAVRLHVVRHPHRQVLILLMHRFAEVATVLLVPVNSGVPALCRLERQHWPLADLPRILARKPHRRCRERGDARRTRCEAGSAMLLNRGGWLGGAGCCQGRFRQGLPPPQTQQGDVRPAIPIAQAAVLSHLQGREGGGSPGFRNGPGVCAFCVACVES